MTTNKSYILDDATAVPLGNGYHLGVGIGPDGAQIMFLVSPHRGAKQGDAGPEAAPHEQVGKALPRSMKEALALTCGRATAHGTPCRHTVGQPGDPCIRHVGAPRIADRSADQHTL